MCSNGTRLTVFCFARAVGSQVLLKMIHGTLQGKEVVVLVYHLPITFILGRLPVVRAGDTGTIPLSYCDCCRNGSHRYNHDFAKADTSAVAGQVAARAPKRTSGLYHGFDIFV